MVKDPVGSILEHNSERLNKLNITDLNMQTTANKVINISYDSEHTSKCKTWKLKKDWYESFKE